MATIRLIPSTYSSSSSSYATVSSGASNMYNNTDHTSNYATLRGRNRNSSTAYYIFIRGFNFDDVPDNAVVSSFTVKIRCYRSSNQRTGANYYLRLASQASNSYVISNTTTSTNIGTSASVITIPTGNLTWTQLSDYGENFSIEVPLSSTSSSYPYIYVYGAEIEVTYSLPVSHSVTSSISGPGNIYPSGTVSVTEGDNYLITISANNPTVTDNGINVTSQLTMLTSGSEVLIPESNTSSGFTITDINNAYNNANNDTYANCALAGGSTGELYLNLTDLVSMPSGSNILDVSASATIQFNANSSSSGFSASCRMYAGTTAKGSSTTIVSGASNVAKTTFTLSPGSSWTESEINNARFYLTATNNASRTQRYIYVYGVSFNITYEVGGDIYTYTITNVTSDHIIVVTTSASSGPKLYVNINGTWKEVITAYKKVNGNWVEQSNISTLFNTTDNFKRE